MSRLYRFANFATTTLANSITSSATTLSVSPGTGSKFPMAPFSLTLQDAATHSVYEVLYVTAITGDVLTVQRGQEGTSAVAWNAGDVAYGGISADAANGFAQNVQKIAPQTVFSAEGVILTAHYNDTLTLSFNTLSAGYAMAISKMNIIGFSGTAGAQYPVSNVLSLSTGAGSSDQILGSQFHFVTDAAPALSTITATLNVAVLGSLDPKATATYSLGLLFFPGS